MNQAGAVELETAPPVNRAPVDPSLLIVLLLLVGAVGAGGAAWRRGRQRNR
ncbi:MAG: hypothetical protein IPM07_09385 [Anaerolineales bacterium]|nr:hypothetical protein [Anaerolineales bacterium]